MGGRDFESQPFSQEKSHQDGEHYNLNRKSKHQSLGAGREAVASQEKMSLMGVYLENGLLFLLLPRMVVPAGPSLALSLNQLAGGSFKSVFSSRRANAVRGGAEEYFTTARLFTSLPPRNKADP